MSAVPTHLFQLTPEIVIAARDCGARVLAELKEQRVPTPTTLVVAALLCGAYAHMKKVPVSSVIDSLHGVLASFEARREPLS